MSQIAEPDTRNPPKRWFINSAVTIRTDSNPAEAGKKCLSASPPCLDVQLGVKLGASGLGFLCW